MRKPKTPSGPADDATPPPGGHALGRARQFAQSRGLPAPAADTPADARKSPARKSPRTTKP